MSRSNTKKSKLSSSKLSFHKIFTWVGFALILFILVIFFFPYSTFDDSLKGNLQSELAALGIRSEIDSVTFSMPPEISFNRLALEFPIQVQLQSGVSVPLALPVVVDQGKLNSSLWQLLLLNFDNSWDLKLYGGQLTGKTRGTFSNLVSDVTITGDKIEIGENPFFQSNAISALLSFNFEGKISNELKPLPVSSGELRLSIANGYYGGGHKIQSGLITLPAVEDLSLQGSAQLNNSQVLLKDLKIDSSLGSANFSGHVRFDKSLNQVERGILKGNVRLSETGTQSLAGYLALAANENPSIPHSDWKIFIRKRPGQRPESIIRKD